jgi:hypothetical protein
METQNWAGSYRLDVKFLWFRLDGWVCWADVWLRPAFWLVFGTELPWLLLGLALEEDVAGMAGFARCSPTTSCCFTQFPTLSEAGCTTFCIFNQNRIVGYMGHFAHSGTCVTRLIQFFAFFRGQKLINSLSLLGNATTTLTDLLQSRHDYRANARMSLAAAKPNYEFDILRPYKHLT